MNMVLKIDGIDMVDYIAYGGFKWQRSDVDGSDAGRDLSGKMRRNRVATKVRLDITCRLLKSEELEVVLTAVMPEYVTVKYYDPQQGIVVTKTMYSNNNPATFQLKRPDGTVWWSGVTFPLIEQ